MNKTVVSSPALGEQFLRVEHPSGLTILLCPMEGFSTAYAMFAAKVGSIDTTFKTQREEDFVEVPAGIAHFLEHKMFECDDGDAFAKYAKTGASANAFTSFDRTAYLFSWTLSPAPTSPRRRCRRSRASSARRSGCTTTTRAGGPFSTCWGRCTTTTR